MDIPLEALKTFPYAGRTIVRGETFHAKSLKDARLLTLTKIARRSIAAFQQRQAIETALVDTQDAVTEPPVESDPPRRRYRRKDITAEPE